MIDKHVNFVLVTKWLFYQLYFWLFIQLLMFLISKKNILPNFLFAFLYLLITEISAISIYLFHRKILKTFYIFHPYWSYIDCIFHIVPPFTSVKFFIQVLRKFALNSLNFFIKIELDDFLFYLYSFISKSITSTEPILSTCLSLIFILCISLYLEKPTFSWSLDS